MTEDFDKMKKGLIDESYSIHDAECRKQPKEVTISEALRMHSGYVRVKGGMISGSRKLEKMPTNIFFTCGNCKTVNEVWTYPRPRFAYETSKTEYSKLRKCINCSEKIGHEYDHDVRNAVKIELQDVETFSDLERLSAVLFDDCTNNVGVGEQVIVTGQIHKIRMSNSIVAFLFVDKIEYENREELEELTEIDIKEIQDLVKKSNEKKMDVIDMLVLMFAPSIIDYQFVKKGLLMCAVNSGIDSVNQRLRINALLIGETGLDKSPMLRAATKLVAKSRYCSALNSSIRSLIGIVDKEDDNLMLRLGPVASSSGAICAIDEIGRMQFEDQGHLLSALQEGKIPFAKHGFSTTLDGSATFIMSANPNTNDGKWRHEGKIERNEIPLLGPFLDRNDLIFIFRTNRNKADIIKYAFDKADMDEFLYAEEERDFDRLRKYVSYCKRFHPVLSHESKNMLIQFYASVAAKTGSPRIFDTLKNISFAIARLKQKDAIEVEDADEAIEFYNVILQQLEEIVIITKDPRQLAVDEIISILSSTKYRYDFVELVKIACKNNEFVARYIGNDFHVESNKKLRSLRKRFLDGVDNRIVVVSLSPLVLEWRTNKTDQNDPTDHNDQQEGKKSNIASDTTDDISSDMHFSKISPVSQVSHGSRVSASYGSSIKDYETYVASSKTKIDAEMGDNSEKHDAYRFEGRWYCRKCNDHGDRFYMTEETSCKGDKK